MEVRVCANGHQVPQENLKACPACGASLAAAEFVEVDGVVAHPTTDTARPVETEVLPEVPAVLSGLPAGLVFLVPGVILSLLGWLASAAADGNGTAFGGSILVLALGGILTSIGVIAIGVRVGIDDARHR
ncbi:hypothetical protein [Nocardioides jensenii]|uniref:hypothetical protein n=1 Tax=Nocardioides jensenii TaxID=1843 RepID=UPI00083024FE|nr:hypothetical protein [Nocardioides jensenii]